jgi:tRNA A-37 threonylcarbamoyl transferase component Bud32
MIQGHSHRSNPFFNRQRITDPAYFYGREREVEALYSAIATRQCRSIVGERKLGKSSLLTQLAQPATLREHGLDPAEYLFIYIDLEGMANIGYNEFWPELVDRLEAALPAEQADLRQAALQLLDQEEIRFMQVRRLFRRLERAGLTVVLMLDEFESLAGNGAFNAGFYGELRSLAGEIGVVYLTASKRSLYELTFRDADTLSSPFFNIFSEERLGLMTAVEAEEMLITLWALGESPPPLSLEDCRYLLELTGPHPFFAQMAAAYLYQERQEQADEEGLLDKVARRFTTEAEDHYRYLWSQLDDEERQALLTPTTELCPKLRDKALLVEEDDGRFQPFSQAFDKFLRRAAAALAAASDRTAPFTASGRAPAGDTGGLTGSTLGSYRVLNVIGRGGMALVYKGYQASLDRYVAIKVMSNHLADDQTFIERFQREAASVAQLRHQNIVQMVDFGMRNDLSYMVMEYIDGDTLKSQFDPDRNLRRPLPLPEAVQIARDIAAALDYAHAHNIIHRDVKPANIMLRREERLAKLTGAAPFTAVLTDFGVARMVAGMQLTGTGATIGTPDYMSPEQARGLSANPASDIYALGIVLYEMLTGQLPFIADTPVATLFKHIQEPPPSLTLVAPHLPLAAEDVLRRALAKDPAERFATAGQLAVAFAEAVE